MACRACGKSLPLIRKGYPTVYAYGPFEDYEEVEYTEVEQNGTIQKDDSTDAA